MQDITTSTRDTQTYNTRDFNLHTNIQLQLVTHKHITLVTHLSCHIQLAFCLLRLLPSFTLHTGRKAIRYTVYYKT